MDKSFHEFILRIKYQNSLDKDNVDIAFELICTKSKTKALLNINNENELIKEVAREILKGKYNGTTYT
jgi:hypothetical protein